MEHKEWPGAAELHAMKRLVADVEAMGDPTGLAIAVNYGDHTR